MAAVARLGRWRHSVRLRLLPLPVGGTAEADLRAVGTPVGLPEEPGRSLHPPLALAAATPSHPGFMEAVTLDRDIAVPASDSASA